MSDYFIITSFSVMSALIVFATNNFMESNLHILFRDNQLLVDRARNQSYT